MLQTLKTMKHLLLPVVLAFTALQACSQKLNADKVPASVKASFQKAHPGVQGAWEKEEGNYEVNFKEGGKEMSCVIDGAGSIMETETAISAQELPQPAKDYMQQHYKGAKIKEAAKIVKASGEITYEAEVNNNDVIFDASGKFLRVGEKEKEDDDKD
jgi:hypothetical protein